GEPREQRAEPLRGAVGEGARGSRGENARERARERGGGEEIRSGERAREGDAAPPRTGRVERAEARDLATVECAREEPAPRARGPRAGRPPRRRHRRRALEVAGGNGERAPADVRAHDAPLLELRVGRHHGVPVDAEAAGEIARRGQAPGGAELGLLDPRAEILRDLLVPGGWRLV